MTLRAIIAVVLLASSTLSFGANNMRLQEVVNADQAERQQQRSAEEWVEISKRDEARRGQVSEELKAGRVLTALDFYNAALVMQHGSTLEDIRMAHSLAAISAHLSPERSAKWLTAASWDRMMMYQKKPQWYGTQYVRDQNDKWALYDVDESAVTDADRVALSVPTLAESRKRTEDMNRAR